MRATQGNCGIFVICHINAIRSKSMGFTGVINSDRASSKEILGAWVMDARSRTLSLIEDLDDEQLMGAKRPTTNPLLWEIAHATWFQERWVLQHVAGQKPLWPDVERLFDSISIEHETRWDLPMPGREKSLAYVRVVRDNVLDLLERADLTNELLYFVKLSVFHEDMHSEAFTYTRQTNSYPAPNFAADNVQPPNCSNTSCKDAEIRGGTFQLGATRDAAFVFDNEKWSHEVGVEPFAISRTTVSQAEFAAFVDDGGYTREELWSSEGWKWLIETDARLPIYWKKVDGEWQRRHFDRWLPLDLNAAAIHVNWYEASAYCKWAGRRLPTEVEWELAATGWEDKRHYPWGEDPPSIETANLDWRAMGTIDVAGCKAGESPFGCRQMLGNVWEWTNTTFNPFPGFTVDPYKEYSQTSFGCCKVLRGGCYATRSRLLRNTWRNYYQCHRRDVLAGFRTCAL